MHKLIVEDSLENTLNCVPKVQGDVSLNLSGKRTETDPIFFRKWNLWSSPMA
jgi:hypothetical protein